MFGYYDIIFAGVLQFSGTATVTSKNDCGGLPRSFFSFYGKITNDSPMGG